MKDMKKLLFLCTTLNVIIFYLLITWNYSVSVINPFVMYCIVSLVVIVSYLVCAIVIFFSILNEVDEDDEL